MAEFEGGPVIVRQHQPDWYQRLRLSIRRWSTGGGRFKPWADALLLLPDLMHLTVQVLRDARVRVQDRALLAFALAYVFTPFDLLPEALFGVPGLLDDLALLAGAYHIVLQRIPQFILMDYWAGPVPLLDIVTRVVSQAESWLGPRRYRWVERILRTEDQQAVPTP